LVHHFLRLDLPLFEMFKLATALFDRLLSCGYELLCGGVFYHLLNGFPIPVAKPAKKPRRGEEGVRPNRIPVSTRSRMFIL